MPQSHRDFFTPGKQYRAPMFVATSIDQGIATTRFLAQLEPASPDQQPPHQEPCLWIFHFDGSLPEGRRCLHVNFIDRTDGSVGGDELEFLTFSSPRTQRSSCGARAGRIARSSTNTPRGTTPSRWTWCLTTGTRRRTSRLRRGREQCNSFARTTHATTGACAM